MRSIGLALTAVLLLAGCMAPSNPPTDPGVPETGGPGSFAFKDGAVHLEVPVQVILVGFAPPAVAHLQESLRDKMVGRVTGDFNQPLPPDPNGGVEGNMPLSGATLPFPFLPKARFNVTAAPASVEAAVGSGLPGLKLEGNPERYDGDRFEALLAGSLEDAGYALDPDTPSLAVVHLDAFGIPVHTWDYTYQKGSLDRLTAFGERTPLIVWDPSATAILQGSLVQEARGTAPDPYSDRIDPSTPDGLAKIKDGIHTALELRLLHGPVYPIPLQDCHAITLIYAYRTTNAAGKLGFRDGAELLDVPALHGAFANLTQGVVHVDAKVLELPLADPVLDAISRGEFGTMEALRFWLTQNWQKYWVPHEGCEPYVSFVMEGDLASVPTGILGIGTYDDRTYRISMSWVNEALRLVRDPETKLPVAPLGDGEYNWVNFLFAHEVGHTMGMHHTFHAFDADGGVQENHLFENVWSVMGYREDGRTIDFGSADAADFQRNRMAYLFAAAHEQGMDGSEAWAKAASLADAHDWLAASQALWNGMRHGSNAGAALADLAGGLALRPHPH